MSFALAQRRYPSDSVKLVFLGSFVNVGCYAVLD